MEYQKIINLLDNTPNQLSKFRAKNWTEINDQWRGVYIDNSDIRFKTSMLKWCIHTWKGRITITEVGVDAAARQAGERGKELTFKKLCSIY